MSYFATEYREIYKTEIKVQLYLVSTVVKNPPANAGDVSSIPGESYRQRSLVVTIHGVAKSQT